MRNSLKRLIFFGVLLTFLICACDDDHIPVFPEPVPEPEQHPPPNTFRMDVSNAFLCPGEKTQISLSKYDRKSLDLGDYNFFISPEIGNLNLDSGYYQAPSSLDTEVYIELWAENKKDTSWQSGKVLQIIPNVFNSYILTNFNGITEAADSKQLPDGSLIFASNNPTENAGIVDFEIFCTDQKGNLLWKNKLGKGTLRRLYVGADAIYGLGYMNPIGFVVTKFDFQGNHLATKNLGIGVEFDNNIIQNLKGTFNDRGDFFISYGKDSLRMMLKLDKDMNLSSVNFIPTYGDDVYSLDGSKFLITRKKIVGGFIVTDSELKILWEKSPDISFSGLDIARVIKTETGWEIWTIFREYSSNSVFLKKYDLSGNQIEEKKLSFKERLYKISFHDIVQLPNGTIWFITSSDFYPSTKPFLMYQIFFYPFQLFQLSKNGDIIKESYVARLNFTPPSFPGGWKLKYQGLFQGHKGIILTGQWYQNFVVQFSTEDMHSPCNF